MKLVTLTKTTYIGVKAVVAEVETGEENDQGWK